MCKILVVDDDEDVRDLARVHLSVAGHEVYGANNGADALQFLAAHDIDPPCLLLVDLRMPVLDGWDLLDALSGNPKWANLPVIVCSASIRPGAAPPLLRAKAYWSRRPAARQFQKIHEYCPVHQNSSPPTAFGDGQDAEVTG